MTNTKTFTVGENYMEIRGFDESEVETRYSVTIDGNNILLKKHKKGFRIHQKNYYGSIFCIKLARKLKSNRASCINAPSVKSGDDYILEAPAGIFLYSKPVTFISQKKGRPLGAKNKQNVTFAPVKQKPVTKRSVNSDRFVTVGLSAAVAVILTATVLLFM